jgi:hypothetical protein
MIDPPTTHERWPPDWLSLFLAVNLTLAATFGTTLAFAGLSISLAIGIVLAATSAIGVVGLAVPVGCGGGCTSIAGGEQCDACRGETGHAQRVRVEAGAVDDMLELAVWNDGPGFSLEPIPPGHEPDTLRRRFDTLRRGSKSPVNRRDEKEPW